MSLLFVRVQGVPYFRVCCERLGEGCSSKRLRMENSGGEGGIRTLGTGVSPYNSLANSTRPTPIARNQSFTVTSSDLSRTESGCSADANAPEYAPAPGFEPRDASAASRLVTRPVNSGRIPVTCDTICRY